MDPIRSIEKHETGIVKHLIHLTIERCYPAIYPSEVVNFFLNYHTGAEIEKRMQNGLVIVFEYDRQIRGTGFLQDEEMGGVYVHPDFQRRGIGEKIVRYLTDRALEQGIERIWLDATPLAKPLYDKLGFSLISPMTQWVGKVPLHYFKMEKRLGKV